jgi:hypothetical protein
VVTLRQHRGPSPLAGIANWTRLPGPTLPRQSCRATTQWQQGPRYTTKATEQGLSDLGSSMLYPPVQLLPNAGRSDMLLPFSFCNGLGGYPVCYKPGVPPSALRDLTWPGCPVSAHNRGGRPTNPFHRRRIELVLSPGWQLLVLKHCICELKQGFWFICNFKRLFKTLSNCFKTLQKVSFVCFFTCLWSLSV